MITISSTAHPWHPLRELIRKASIEISRMTGLKPSEGVEPVRYTEPDPMFALIESIGGCTRPTATRSSPALGF